MKRLLVGLMVVAFVLLGAGSVSAQVRSWDDLDWWAQSGSGPDPVKDAKRSGYWWWPIDPASNASDDELWGNRGVVYGMFAPAPPPPPPPPPRAPEPPAPAPAPAPIAERSIPVFNNVLFDYDKADVSAAGRAEIANLASIMKEYGGDAVTVEGHTCDLNRTGDPAYNDKLGKRRADAVQAVLIAEGIPASRISTKSYGDNRPAVANSSDENRKLNRRVVFVYAIGD